MSIRIKKPAADPPIQANTHTMQKAGKVGSHNIQGN
jgi:hypothetical protein